MYATIFAWYYLHHFLIIFFNSALIGCASIRLSGGDPNARGMIRSIGGAERDFRVF